MAMLKGKYDVAPLECLLCVLPNLSWKHLVGNLCVLGTANNLLLGTTSGRMAEAEVKSAETGLLLLASAG